MEFGRVKATETHGEEMVAFDIETWRQHKPWSKWVYVDYYHLPHRGVRPVPSVEGRQKASKAWKRQLSLTNSGQFCGLVSRRGLLGSVNFR